MMEKENGTGTDAGGPKGSWPRIYIGPTLPGVVHGTVFTNGLPPALNEKIKAVPAVGELVVPVSGLRDANRELADRESALSRIYRLAEEKGGREG